jgi:hypothetical protein
MAPKKYIDDCEAETVNPSHLEYLKNIPPYADSRVLYRQMLCRQCKLGKTVHWCSKCEVPLHKEQCFAQFHEALQAKKSSLGLSLVKSMGVTPSKASEISIKWLRLETSLNFLSNFWKAIL